MGFSLIKVKFIKPIHKPTQNCEIGVPKPLFSLIGYLIVSTIDEEIFFDTCEEIPKDSVVCVHPQYPVHNNNLERVYRENLKRSIGEDLRRELIYYGMV